MARFVKGDVVIVPFPFSAQQGFKSRPAVVVASWAFGQDTDYLVCIITSQNAPDPHIIELETSDVENGSLNRKSYLRPTYLFAVGESQIRSRVGSLVADKLQQAVSAIIQIISA